MNTRRCARGTGRWLGACQADSTPWSQQVLLTDYRTQFGLANPAGW